MVTHLLLAVSSSIMTIGKERHLEMAVYVSDPKLSMDQCEELKRRFGRVCTMIVMRYCSFPLGII
jgi:hypothetical protein